MIRIARPEDAPALREIYAPYVKNTARTFEYDVPTVEEFRGRIENTLKKYPYFVCERNGEIIGYTYASMYRVRAAYIYDAEPSIYVKEEARGVGAGRELYEALENALSLQHVVNVYASVASIDVEDEYLTHSSLRFHEHLGYTKVGTFKNCGHKFGRWYDMTWMSKSIRKHTADPAPWRTFPEIRAELLEKFGIS